MIGKWRWKMKIVGGLKRSERWKLLCRPVGDAAAIIIIIIMSVQRRPLSMMPLMMKTSEIAINNW